eukprot:1157615-Pelagomonas_calceolata.AAC.4
MQLSATDLEIQDGVPGKYTKGLGQLYAPYFACQVKLNLASHPFKEVLAYPAAVTSLHNLGPGGFLWA